MSLKTKKILLQISQLIILLLLMFSVFLFMKTLLFSVATNYVLDDSNFEEPKPTSVLILGSDAEQPSSVGSARTDVMIVATLNPSNQFGNTEVNTISIPRDVLMKNTCSGEYSKANEIYSYAFSEDNPEAAIDCTKSSIEEFLNIPIDYYVETSFSGLVNMVDGIGGIEIDVQYEFCEQDSAGNPCAIEFSPGLQTLNGEEALAYARQRKYSSDYERNLRQQQVISAILSKVLANPTKYLTTFIDVYTENVNTNLGAQDLLSYSNILLNLLNNMMTNLSSDSPLIIDIKTSPTSNVTSIGEGSDLILGLDLTNIDEKSQAELYETPQKFIDNELYNQLISATSVQELYISRKNTPFASAKTVDVDGNPVENNAVSHIIEIQNYSIKVEDINGAYGFYSYASPYSLNYTSNMLRLSLDLDPEVNIFDYSIVDDFGGPSVSAILYLDEQNFDVDLSTLYSNYQVSRISTQQYENENALQTYDPVEEVVCDDTQTPIDSDFDGIVDSCQDPKTTTEDTDTNTDNSIDELVCLDTEEIIDGKCVTIEVEIPEEVVCNEGEIATDSNGDGINDSCLSPPVNPTCNENEELVHVDGQVDENGFDVYVCVPKETNE